MITVRLYGGLGNQMFQYASALALAKRKNTQLRLDTQWFTVPHKNTTVREYELSLFPHIQEPCGNFFNFFQRNRIGKIQRFFQKFHFDYEKTFFDLCYEGYDDWTERLLACKEDTYFLHGYWQSEKYFADQEEAVRHAFTFPEFTDEKNIDLAQHLKTGQFISVHVRRTDYVYINGKYDPSGEICTLDYYRKAAEIIKNRVENPVFILFSDDIPWCKENLTLPGETLYADWNKGKQAYCDMCLMSMCSHHIIANSSFSWWGAYLNANKEKMVIAPAKWCKGYDPFEKLHCPASWIRI